MKSVHSAKKIDSNQLQKNRFLPSLVKMDATCKSGCVPIFTSLTVPGDYEMRKEFIWIEEHDDRKLGHGIEYYT